MRITSKNKETTRYPSAEQALAGFRVKTKELVGSTYRRSIRKDKKGNIVIVDVDDPRIQSEGLVGASKYIAVMKDTHGNVVRVPINDPRIASGELRKLKNLI